MTFWKTFWAGLISGILAGAIIIGIIILIISSLIPEKSFKVSDNTVLHMELNGEIGDYTYKGFDQSSLQFYSQFGLYDILEGLQIAKNDDRIKGIFLNCDNIAAGYSTVKEIRDGLTDFKESGKFIVAYSENYDKKGYYLSSVADEVYVFPSGMFEFLGIGAELMFFKGALEKLDIEMQVIRGSNNQFKSAVEPLLYDKMSDANRLQMEKYIGALWGQVLESVSKSRNVSVDKLNEIADSVYIIQSGQAVEHGLADSALYYDEVMEIIKSKLNLQKDKKVNLLSFKKYASKKVKKKRDLAKLEDKNLALIFAEGEIVDGKGSINQIGGNSLAEDIRDAREDEDIKAVVLRVNSPGGSALASDIIWREVVLTKNVKPVIVSMGDIAASGGYYISCAADMIFAQPNTITGSIGVFGIIPYTGKMFENKLGITFDRVQTNDHSILSTNRKLDMTELAIVQKGVDAIYDDFISKVGHGRRMKKSKVDSIGQGRVWAGVDAIEIGLVDAFGGIYDAIDEAAKRAEIKSEDLAISIYPKHKANEWEEIMENLEDTEAMTSRKTALENQFLDIYNAITSIGTAQGYQARLPFVFWLY